MFPKMLRIEMNFPEMNSIVVANQPVNEIGAWIMEYDFSFNNKRKKMIQRKVLKYFQRFDVFLEFQSKNFDEKTKLLLAPTINLHSTFNFRRTYKKQKF